VYDKNVDGQANESEEGDKCCTMLSFPRLEGGY
jgi:hypothetical protein